MKTGVLIIMLLFVQTATQAQSVGLVLSGGGAKGLAHIGVIKALEENNIPIDYIAGTSMGAIVGGLYAIGFTTDEMEALLNSDDFEKWSYGYIDISEEYYYKRKNETADWISIPIIKENNELTPQLPSNIISPAQMDLRFMQYLEPANAAANYNFNNLMVPFFCVATDVYNNKPVILNHGSLPSAVRASMTFPGYFKPITIDSTLLFDGGMENNFPSDIMIEKFNPDFIIGSKVSQNPKKPDADNVYRQLENVFMKYTNYTMPENGILIEPQVETYNLLDFNAYDSLFAAGYQAAYQKIDTIKQLIKRSETTTHVNKKRQAFKEKYKPLIFQNIFITGVPDETVDYILRNIKRNRVTLTFKEFEEAYFKLLSDKLIKSIYPRAVYNKALGNFDLYLDVKTQNEFSVELGGNISSNVRNLGYAGIDYIFQKKNIYDLSGNFVVGKFYNSIHAKFRMDFPPRTVSRNKMLSPFFIDISATNNNWNYFTTTSEWFIDNDSPLKIDQSESHFQSNFGRPIFNRGLFYTGFAYGLLTDHYFHTNLIEQKDIADETLFKYSSLHATYEYSTLNYKQYANAGRFVKLQARYITGQENYNPGTSAQVYNASDTAAGHSWLRFSANYTKYFKLTPHFTLGSKFAFLYSNKASFNNAMATLLSAPVFQPFPQSKVEFLNDFRANNFAALGIISIFQFTERINLRTEIYAYQAYRDIITDDYRTQYSKKLPPIKGMGSVAFVFQTPLGSLAFTSSYYYTQKLKAYFQLNFGYVLFNKRGID